ncbi:MAG: GNAT family N-acetyltransferase [Kofleriaceae bacterium]
MSTARLAFRSWRESDLPFAQALFGDPRVTALVGGPFSDDQVKARLASEMACEAAHGYQYWPMFDNETFVGCCGLKPRPDGGIELGFYVCVDHHGRGYAVEAARSVIAHAFDLVGADRIFAGHHPNNVGSRRTLEKLGFIYAHDEFYPPTGLQHPGYYLQRIRVRPFEPDEWARLREIRLEALQTDPGVFAGSYAASQQRPEADWRSLIEAPDRRAFGLFDGNRVVGVTGVLPASAPRTAVLVMSFISPAYRGRGLSKLFYEARLAWLRANPLYDRVIVSHRQSNEASRRANQRFGFVPTHVESRTWPDGVVEDEPFYELHLR